MKNGPCDIFYDLRCSWLDSDETVFKFLAIEHSLYPLDKKICNIPAIVVCIGFRD